MTTNRNLRAEPAAIRAVAAHLLHAFADCLDEEHVDHVTPTDIHRYADALNPK